MDTHCKYDALVDPRTLKDHPKNRNKHSKDQVKRLASLYQFHGIRHPIIVSKRSDCIVAGHGRKAAALKAGIKKFPVVYQAFKDDAHEYAFLQADNAIALWADLDLDAIRLDLPELGKGFDVDQLGIKDFSVEDGEKKGLCDEDEIPEKVPAKTKLGQIFRLGTHRLMCGDSTSIDAVEKLLAGDKVDMVFTDPPYGIDLDTDYSKITGSKNTQASVGTIAKSYTPIIGDDEPFDPRFMLEYFVDCQEVFLWGADYYSQRVSENGAWLVWDKNNGNESADKMIGSGYEICWSKQRHKKEMCRIFGRGTFGHDKTKVHPTQKPVQLAEWFFERWANRLTTVVDLYGGSGSTLIACEKTNRRCFMMEIDPHYCDVIIARWEKYTGQKAVPLIKGKPKGNHGRL